MKEGKYIYCIIAESIPKSFGVRGIGDDGAEVNTICVNDLAAVVSNSPVISYSASRENLLSHEKVIEEVMRDYTVLPVRFCTIAGDESKVKQIIEKEYDKFKELINKIKGKKELGLKVIFQKEAVYKHILEKYENIRQFKKKIAELSPQASYYQRMEIGKMVEVALQSEKDSSKQDILDKLSPLAVEVKTNDTFGERMLLNAAFFVEEKKEKEFDKAVDALDVKYSDKMKFKYVGTLPPFNFVNLVINT
jgi:hypothetical protein